MNQSITISKGDYSVIMEVDSVVQGFTKLLTVLTPPQSSGLQSNGQNPTRIVDLLRITRVLSIKGYVTSTTTINARTVRDNLISIYNGGGINGGTETLTYDGVELTGHMEKLIITDTPIDEPDDFESNPSSYTDTAKYDISFDFVVGVFQ